MRLLVIGCGSIGKRHAENFLKHAEVAVYDSNPDSLKTLSHRTFNALDSAFAWQPDAVVVSTPHHTHLELANMALDSGSHVLIEKPISHSLAGVDALLQKSASNNKKAYVVCNMRFHSAVAALKENLSRVGRPLFARSHYGNYLPNMRPNNDYRQLYAAHREQGGGVVLDAIHEIDYLQWFFGQVDSVSAEAAKLSDLEINVEDYAVICLRHANGVRSEIHLDYLQACKRRGCEIVGDKGTLLWESEGKMPEDCRVRFYSSETKTWETLYHSKDEQANKPYQDLAVGFVRSMDESSSSLASLQEGRDCLKVALAALTAAEHGKRVELN